MTAIGSSFRRGAGCLVLNPEDGLAVAIHGGIGITPLIPFTAFYLNAGSTLSYRNGQWEPYLVAQQNVSRVNIQGDADSDGFFSFDEEEFDETFLSTSAGLVWWSSGNWGIYIQATILKGLEGSFQELEDSTLFSIGFTSQ